MVKEPSLSNYLTIAGEERDLCLSMKWNANSFIQDLSFAYEFHFL